MSVNRDILDSAVSSLFYTAGGDAGSLAVEKLQTLRTRLAQAEALLRRMEWEGAWHYGKYTCPECQQTKGDGHSSTCEMAAFLKGARDGS